MAKKFIIIVRACSLFITKNFTAKKCRQFFQNSISSRTVKNNGQIQLFPNWFVFWCSNAGLKLNFENFRGQKKFTFLQTFFLTVPTLNPSSKLNPIRLFVHSSRPFWPNNVRIYCSLRGFHSPHIFHSGFSQTSIIPRQFRPFMAKASLTTFWCGISWVVFLVLICWRKKV
jgi:hypothetical protein